MFFEVNTTCIKPIQLVRCFLKAPPTHPLPPHFDPMHSDVFQRPSPIVRCFLKSIQPVSSQCDQSDVFWWPLLRPNDSPMFFEPTPLPPHPCPMCCDVFRSQYRPIEHSPMFFEVNTCQRNKSDVFLILSLPPPYLPNPRPDSIPPNPRPNISPMFCDVFQSQYISPANFKLPPT